MASKKKRRTWNTSLKCDKSKSPARLLRAILIPKFCSGTGQRECLPGFRKVGSMISYKARSAAIISTQPFINNKEKRKKFRDGSHWESRFLVSLYFRSQRHASQTTGRRCASRSEDNLDNGQLYLKSSTLTGESFGYHRFLVSRWLSVLLLQFRSKRPSFNMGSYQRPHSQCHFTLLLCYQ